MSEPTTSKYKVQCLSPTQRQYFERALADKTSEKDITGETIIEEATYNPDTDTFVLIVSSSSDDGISSQDGVEIDCTHRKVEITTVTTRRDGCYDLTKGRKTVFPYGFHADSDRLITDVCGLPKPKPETQNEGNACVQPQSLKGTEIVVTEWANSDYICSGGC